MEMTRENVPNDQGVSDMIWQIDTETTGKNMELYRSETNLIFLFRAGKGIIKR